MYMVAVNYTQFHVMGKKANYDWLMQSLKQYESSRMKAHDLT